MQGQQRRGVSADRRCPGPDLVCAGELLAVFDSGDFRLAPSWAEGSGKVQAGHAGRFTYHAEPFPEPAEGAGAGWFSWPPLGAGISR